LIYVLLNKIVIHFIHKRLDKMSGSVYNSNVMIREV